LVAEITRSLRTTSPLLLHPFDLGLTGTHIFEPGENEEEVGKSIQITKGEGETSAIHSLLTSRRICILPRIFFA
jgi:hypothetical protein